MINAIKQDAQVRMQKSLESLLHAFSRIRTGQAHPSILGGEMVLISMPALTEETRKGFTKQARDAAEDGRVAVRNIRRDALSQLKDLVKEKEISEDEERRAADEIQKLTDKFVAEIEVAVKQKEADLMAV